MIHEYFPPVVQALNEEAIKHPLLLVALRNFELENGGITMEQRFGVIATYCDMMLDGYYIEEELDNLCHIMLVRLKKKSVIQVN